MTHLGPDGVDERSRTAALLRATPPAEAMAWVSQATDGAVVEHCEALLGGSSSAMHVLTLRHRADRTERVVLRRYVLPTGTHEPDVAAREAAALRVVNGIDVPTPLLLGLDPSGTEAGVPALLMSELEGKPLWEPRHRQRWCVGLAEALVAIHDVALPLDGAIRTYRPHQQKSYIPPGWARDVVVWEHAIEIFYGPTIDVPGRFIHRDFHPGNVLWRGTRISGVVDWQHTSIGPTVVDVGHNRLNLFFYDEDLAELFTTAWQQVTSAEYHPWADIVGIIGALDNLRTSPPPQRARRTIENALAAAVASMGT